MGYTLKAVPEPQTILRAWLPFKEAIGVTDLGTCAPQSRISDILSGRRSISKAIAKRLGQRFHVRADVFL